jgi:hypothetical protein
MMKPFIINYCQTDKDWWKTKYNWWNRKKENYES